MKPTASEPDLDECRVLVSDTGAHALWPTTAHIAFICRETRYIIDTPRMTPSSRAEVYRVYRIYREKSTMAMHAER